MTNIRRWTIIGLLGLTLGLGVGFIIRPEPVFAAEQCGGADGKHIKPDKLAPCLAPNQPTTSPSYFVVNVWKWSLSLVNIFAAIVLIVMAFANILYPWQALEPYRIRQLLPTFIWGVILANASLFICRAVVTLADLLMSGMGEGGLRISIAQLYQAWGFKPELLNWGVVAAVFGKITDPDPGVMAYRLIASTVLVFLPLIGLLFLAFIFYFRSGLVFVFSAISPLAFGAMIFPATRGYLGRWWDMFWRWSFGGVASWLLLYLASQIKPGATGATTVGSGFSPDMAIPYLIALALVWMAIMAPFKLGGAISSMITGMTRKWGGALLGAGIGATKFLGSKGYHYAGLGATHGVLNAEDALKKAEEGKGPNKIAAAQKRLAWARGLHGFVRAPSIIKGGFAARKELEEKTLKRGMMGAPLYESLAGREAAMAARREDFEFISQLPDIKQQIGMLQDIKKKYGVDDAWLYELYSKKPAEAAKMSLKKGLSTEDTLKAQQAVRGYFTNARYLRYGQTDPTALLAAGLGAESAEKGAEAALNFQRLKQQEARAARRTGVAPAGAAVAEAQFGVSRDHSLAAAQQRLQGLGRQITANDLAKIAADSSVGGTLDRARFHNALASRLKLTSLTGDEESIADQLHHDLGRLSTQTIQLDPATIEAERSWQLQLQEKKPGQDTLAQLQDSERKYESLLDRLADKPPDVKISEEDRNVIVQQGVNVQLQLDDTNNNARAAIQRGLAATRHLSQQIQQFEQATAQQLETRLEQKPVEVEINAEKAFRTVIKQGGEGLPDLTMDNFSRSHAESFLRGLGKLKSRIARDYLFARESIKAQKKEEFAKMMEGIKVFERMQAAAEERGAGSVDTFAAMVRLMGKKRAAAEATPTSN